MTLYLTKQIKSHTTSIRQCVLMIENIEIQISYSNLKLSDLIKKLSVNANFSNLTFIDEIAKRANDICNFNGVFNEVFANKRTMASFDDEDIELLKGFFSGLGKSDINGQILNCKTYKEFFKHKLELLESQEAIKCKSQTAITVGLGLIFSIVII